MLTFLALLIVPPMLIAFCLLRCGGKSVLRCAFLAAVLNTALWIVLQVACNWGIQMTGESSPTPAERFMEHVIFYSMFVIVVTAISLIPATLFGILYSRWRRFTHDSAA